jgi:acyl-coenzyme A synthetase/AMP-(fatty) acid ligase
MKDAFRETRARLSADPALGTGNVLSTLVAGGIGLDRPALTFDVEVDGHPAWQPLTLRQLDRCVAARAAWLHDRGIGRHDPVAVYSRSAPDHVLTFLALARLGAIAALVNGNIDGPLAAAYLRRLRVVGVVTDAVCGEQLAGHELGAAKRLGQAAACGAGDPAQAPPPYRHHPDDPVSITHSSGTTGVPKGVVHSHRTLFVSNRHRLMLPPAQGVERTLSALPAAHAATVIAVNLALGNGAELLALSRQDGQTVLRAIERWRPSGVFGFATTWADLARADLSGRDLGSVRLWWNTGDCAHESHIRRLVSVGQHDAVTKGGRVRRRGSLFIDGLGTTEIGQSPFYIIHRPDTDRYDRCIGRPHPHVKVAVLGHDGEELPPGQVGHLGVRAESLMLGYWNDSLATCRTYLRGWYLPGDQVYRDEDGYFHHLDRTTDAVSFGDGTYLYTSAAEERVLARCPDVADCTVVAVNADGRVVTDVLLALMPGADGDADRRAQVLAALDDRIGATLREVTVTSGEEIPIGPTGKVRKHLLRERHGQAETARTAAGTLEMS